MKLAYFLKDATASGGMERVLSNKCAWWCAQGHEVHVVSLVDPQGREPFFPFPAQVRHHNLGLQRIYRKGLANKLRKGRNVEAFVAAADRWLTQFQPDIVFDQRVYGAADGQHVVQFHGGQLIQLSIFFSTDSKPVSSCPGFSGSLPLSPATPCPGAD